MAGSMGPTIAGGAPLLGAAAGFWFILQGMAKAGIGLKDIVKHRIVIFLMMIGVCAVYGLIGMLLISKALTTPHLGHPHYVPENAATSAGYILGIVVMCTAGALGIFGGEAAPCIVEQPRAFVVVVLCAIFIEAVGFYGFIIGLVVTKDAQKSVVDIAPDHVLPFAAVAILPCLGCLAGSLVSGISIVKAAVVRPQIAMRLVVTLVISQNLGIYGLICALIDAGGRGGDWPPTNSGYMGSLLMLLSGVLIAYVAYTGIPAVSQEPSLFKSLLMKLIGCASVGLAGLFYELLVTIKKPKTDQDEFQDDLMALPGAGLEIYKALLVSILVLFAVSLFSALKWGARHRFLVHPVPLLG